MPPIRPCSPPIGSPFLRCATVVPRPLRPRHSPPTACGWHLGSVAGSRSKSSTLPNTAPPASIGPSTGGAAKEKGTSCRRGFPRACGKGSGRRCGIPTGRTRPRHRGSRPSPRPLSCPVLRLRETIWGARVSGSGFEEAGWDQTAIDPVRCITRSPSSA